MAHDDAPSPDEGKHRGVGRASRTAPPTEPTPPRRPVNSRRRPLGVLILLGLVGLGVLEVTRSGQTVTADDCPTWRAEPLTSTMTICTSDDGTRTLTHEFDGGSSMETVLTPVEGTEQRYLRDAESGSTDFFEELPNGDLAVGDADGIIFIADRQ